MLVRRICYDIKVLKIVRPVILTKGGNDRFVRGIRFFEDQEREKIWPVE